MPAVVDRPLAPLDVGKARVVDQLDGPDDAGEEKDRRGVDKREGHGGAIGGGGRRTRLRR